MMDDIDRASGESPNSDKIRSILDASLLETDFFCRKSRSLLAQLGLPQGEDLLLLARHKSKVKYGYDIAPETLPHILDLAGQGDKQSLRRLVESPFFLVKASWLYEHAPYFLFFNREKAADLDDFITRFADEYETQLLESRVSVEEWEKIRDPWRVRAVTFWDNQIFDPVALVDRVRREKIAGFELSVDFHPFNYKKLLPEEFSPEKRALIREASHKAGLNIDIHSPIVGPYAPCPDPKKGHQLFFDPMKCFAIQCETVQLACDIGAGAVVFHLIDHTRAKEMAELVMKAEGTSVRVTFENYCQLEGVQSSEVFAACLEEIIAALPEGVRRNNFGVTLDVGHLNIEGEDPLVGAERIGLWCLANGIPLRLHATDNYGKLLFSPPAYSADVHGNVSGRGINSALIITLLRSLGLEFDVVAEQIQPLSHTDIALIHKAQTMPINEPYESVVSRGRDRLAHLGFEPLITPSISNQNAYRFLAGLSGIAALKEYLVFRRIQDQKYLSVDEAKKISQDFMKMPLKFRNNLTEYIDELLLPIQSESGVLQKSELDLICQNISGALFGTLNNEHLNQIFSEVRSYRKGETICKQNSIGQEMYYIKDGEATVSLNSSPLATLKPGEIFGEISLFYNVERTATIKANADHTEIGVLTRSGFEALLKGSEPHSHDLVYRLYSILPERLRNLNDKYRTAINTLYLIAEGHHMKMGKGGMDADVSLGPKGDFFPTITREEARLIFKETKTFDAGQIVFTEGDDGDGAYLVLEGKAKAVTSSEGDEKITLGQFDSGEIFGEMALIDNKPRSASVVTVTPCQFAFIEKESFVKYIETRSNLSFRLMAFICLSLFKRIITLDKEYADLKKQLGREHRQ
jgi:CRP-like cAMP-binding protein/sugar phosphate isomerase/epimerase